ncbi:hypothetical protein D9611_004748 [Ephemerocybe angulata]|uniref:Uncharacterized protein n=1 Tax=Ephemerocybe angulata TaxID=980116 RepID=A0A8H5B373_9AGAR|nr:hypothetical protein D9611_004748 [Tulosesus angulatus]
MIELNDFSRKRATTADSEHDTDGVDGPTDDSGYAIPSGVLLVLSATFLCFPGFAFYLASNTEVTVTPLERFLTTHLGIYFSVVGVSLLLRTTRHPLLIPLTIGSSLSAFLSYNSTTVGSLATLIFLSQLVLSMWGVYSLLFGDEPLHLHRSKTTGADKRTSAFIFGNTAAASSQKKEWVRKEKARER